MEFSNLEVRKLAERIYDLDTEVYEQLGSSLGRVFSKNRERSVSHIVELLYDRGHGYRMRSELALISNMARTISEKPVRKQIMIKYNDILHDVMEMSTSFAQGDVLDPKIADLNTVNLKERFKEKDHMIICIGRTYGSAGNDIGFNLADELKINFYDIFVMNEVLKKEDEMAFREGRTTPLQWIRDFRKFHGVTKRDMQFFEISRFLVQKAKEEDFVVMGRYADAILTNNLIPHVSIFITAPERRRIQRIASINEGMTIKQAKHMVEVQDSKHKAGYEFYTGRTWSKASNYDLCINSASYGIQGSVDLIKRMIGKE